MFLGSLRDKHNTLIYVYTRACGRLLQTAMPCYVCMCARVKWFGCVVWSIKWLYVLLDTCTRAICSEVIIIIRQQRNARRHAMRCIHASCIQALCIRTYMRIYRRHAMRA